MLGALRGHAYIWYRFKEWVGGYKGYGPTFPSEIRFCSTSMGRGRKQGKWENEKMLKPKSVLEKIEVEKVVEKKEVKNKEPS